MTTTNPGTNGQQSAAMVVGPQKRLNDLRDLLDRAKGSIAQVLPKHLTPERLIRIAASAASRNPALLDCTKESFLLAVVQAGMTGLEPNTPLQYSAIVPLKNSKTGKMEAQFWPMYRGLCKLAYNSGEMADIYAEVIYERDQWDIEYGTNKRLFHKPLLTSEDRGNIVGFYCVGKLKSGECSFAFLPKAKVDGIRAKAPGGNSDAWVNHYDEMGKKTAIRAWSKTAPLATEKAEPFMKAIAIDGKVTNGETLEYSDVLDVVGEIPGLETGESSHAPIDRGAALADKVKTS